MRARFTVSREEVVHALLSLVLKDLCKEQNANFTAVGSMLVETEEERGSLKNGANICTRTQ